MKNLINLLAITLLLFTSCEIEPTEPHEQLPEKELNGEAVFKTIFFYLGDEAKAISSYEKQVTLLEKSKLENDKFWKYYEAYAEEYLNKVMEKNPKYIDELKNAVLSKDFEQIKASMVYGGNLMMAITTIDAIKSIKDEKVANEFAIFNWEGYDFTNSKGLELLLGDLDDIMKNEGYDIEKLQSLENQNFNPGFTLNQNGSYTFLQVLVHQICLDYDATLRLAFIQNFRFVGIFDLILFKKPQTSLDNASKYENYSGEKLIEDIAFAF